METAALQSKLVERANAAADVLAAMSLEEHAAVEADEDAAGWELVRQHNSEYACWIVVGGRVLDVTAYLGHHPGGSSVIQKLAGRDATKAYERARHSRGADMKLADFTIGKLSDIKRLRRAAGEARECRQRLEAAAKYLD
jgi:cytochrome b involved in lipid metabolism